MVANPAIAETLSPIEVDAESESFRATYDSTRDSASLGVVAVVAAVLEREPQSLTPLQSVIETDALDKLATASSPGLGNCDSISFAYEGFEITVTSEERIEANSLENT